MSVGLSGGELIAERGIVHGQLAPVRTLASRPNLNSTRHGLGLLWNSLRLRNVNCCIALPDAAVHASRRPINTG